MYNEQTDVCFYTPLPAPAPLPQRPPLPPRPLPYTYGGVAQNFWRLS